MDITLFLDGINETLVCVSCHCVLESPRLLICGHRICAACLYPKLNSKPRKLLSCPKCDVSIVAKSTFQCDKQSQDIIESLNVRCLYFESGCEHKMIVKDFVSHTQKCSFGVTSLCTYCYYSVDSSDLGDHMKQCENRCHSCFKEFSNVTDRNHDCSLKCHICETVFTPENAKEHFSKNCLHSNCCRWNNSESSSEVAYLKLICSAEATNTSVLLTGSDLCESPVDSGLLAFDSLSPDSKKFANDNTIYNIDVHKSAADPTVDRSDITKDDLKDIVVNALKINSAFPLSSDLRNNKTIANPLKEETSTDIVHALTKSNFSNESPKKSSASKPPRPSKTLTTGDKPNSKPPFGMSLPIEVSHRSPSTTRREWRSQSGTPPGIYSSRASSGASSRGISRQSSVDNANEFDLHSINSGSKSDDETPSSCRLKPIKTTRDIVSDDETEIVGSSRRSSWTDSRSLSFRNNKLLISESQPESTGTNKLSESEMIASLRSKTFREFICKSSVGSSQVPLVTLKPSSLSSKSSSKRIRPSSSLLGQPLFEKEFNLSVINPLDTMQRLVKYSVDRGFVQDDFRMNSITNALNIANAYDVAYTQWIEDISLLENLVNMLIERECDWSAKMISSLCERKHVLSDLESVFATRCDRVAKEIEEYTNRQNEAKKTYMRISSEAERSWGRYKKWKKHVKACERAASSNQKLHGSKTSQEVLINVGQSSQQELKDVNKNIKLPWTAKGGSVSALRSGMFESAASTYASLISTWKKLDEEKSKTIVRKDVLVGENELKKTGGLGIKPGPTLPKQISKGSVPPKARRRREK